MLKKNLPSNILSYPTWEPMQHQVRILNDTQDIDTYALFHAMGSGKTYTEILRYRWKCTKEQKLLKWLIVCPLIVMENWKRELLKFSLIPEDQIQIVNGINSKSKAKKKSSSMKIKLEQLQTPNKTIFITNTESLQGLKQQVKLVNGRKVKKLTRKPILEMMLDMNFIYMTIDESHRFKSPTGIRAKTLHILGDQNTTKYKSILTGTPVLNDPADVWSQFRFCAPWLFSLNFMSFRKKYFVDLNSGMPSNVYFPKWVINPDVKEELRAKIFSISDRVTKEEVLKDLPLKTDIIVDVPLSSEQARLYKQMAGDMVATIASKEKVELIPDTLDETLKEQLEEMGINTSKVMSVDLAIVKGLRLQQLVSGIFTDDETGEVTLVDNEADRIIESMLTQHLVKEKDKKNKVIIWCVFKHSYSVLAEIAERVLPKGKYFTFLTGQQDYDEKIANVDKLNDDPDCVGMIANQGAGGTGINLVGANKAYYYSRDFNLEKDLQSDARNHRGGQLRACERFDLVRTGTIDEQAFTALAAKRVMVRDILDVPVTSVFKEINWKGLL